MINRVTLLGRIGKKEAKNTRNGSFFCHISIATNRKYIDAHGNARQLTNWHNVYFFNKLAEITNKYAHVGDLIYIEGELNNKTIEENGTSRSFPVITGNEVKFLPVGKKLDNPAVLEDCSRETNMKNGNVGEQHELSSLYEDDAIGF